MGSATVQGQLWGACPHDRAEVVARLVWLTCGNLASAGAVTAGGDVERPA